MIDWVDVWDIASVSLALFNAAVAGQKYADGDLFGAAIFIAVATLLMAVVLWSKSFEVRRERGRRMVAEGELERQEYGKDKYRDWLEEAFEERGRFAALVRTLVRELDADAVPVELETREDGTVEVVPRDGD